MGTGIVILSRIVGFLFLSGGGSVELLECGGKEQYKRKEHPKREVLIASLEGNPP